MPDTDILTQDFGSYFTDHRVDVRFQLKDSWGSFRFELDPTITWTGGDAVSVLMQSAVQLDQLPGTDSDRFFNLTHELLSNNNHRAVARVDRASIQFRQPSWSIGIGRQAQSWGSGLVFQPLDLFNAFAPTTIDREFKPGVDSILFESLVGDSAEVQVLHIARQDVEPEQANQNTTALKWHVDVASWSLDMTLAYHRGEEYGAVSVLFPIGGALLRSDVSYACHDLDCTLSGLVNLDYTLAVGPALLYLFGELYHNGYGLESATEPVPDSLLMRLERGEIFTLMRNYGAFGLNVTWHPLWSQSVSLIHNLQDGSSMIQSTLNFEPADNSRVQFGITHPFGETNSEFTTLDLGGGFSTGGYTSWFAAMSLYF